MKLVNVSDLNNATKTILHTSTDELVRERLAEYSEVFDMLPANTRKAYLTDMKKLLYWCEENNKSLGHDMETNKLVLKLFFGFIIEQDLAHSTITRIKASVSKFIRLTLMPNPFLDDIFKDWLTLTFRKKPKRPKQALALDLTLLKEVNVLLDESDLFQLRDKVLLNIMFDCLLRANELSNLYTKEISFRKKTLMLRKSKTDQEGVGQQRPLSVFTLSLIKQWKERTGIVNGYLLRQFTPSRSLSNKPLGYDGVYNAFKRFSTLVDLDGEVFTTHSARVGSAVTLAEHDCSMLDIQRSGGWKSPAMPARYTEQVDIHKKGIGALFDGFKR